MVAAGDDDATQCSGYVEVKAIEDPESGHIIDEIMVVVPLPEAMETDEDPLYYYPPSMPDSAKISDDEDSDDSDSDDDDDDFCVDLKPLIITNRHRTSSSNNKATSTDTEQAVTNQSSVDPSLDYSFMEELLQTLDNIFGCSYGTCAGADSEVPALKSALRRKSDNLPPMNRNVSFTKLAIKEFNMTLGNHPSAVTVRFIYCLVLQYTIFCPELMFVIQ